MFSFRVALILVAVGTVVLLIGCFLDRKAPDEIEKKHSLGGTLYLWSCIAFWGVFVYLTLVSGNHVQGPLHGVADEITQIRFASDPVLNVIVWSVVVLVAAVFLIGVAMVGFYIFLIALGLALFSALFVEPLIILAKVSVVGAVVASIIGSVPVILLARRYSSSIGRAVHHVAEPVFGIFFDWWLTPVVLRQKEEKIMDEVDKKFEKARQAMVKVDPPLTPTVMMAPSPESRSGNWITNKIARFHIRDQQKTNQEHIKLKKQEKEYFAETRGAINEYRGVLEAQHDLETVDEAFEEKDDESDLRKLDRQKRRMLVENEIADLKKKAQPAPSLGPPQGSPQQRKLRELRQLREERQEELAKCKGDPEREAVVHRIYDDAEMKLMERR